MDVLLENNKFNLDELMSQKIKTLRIIYYLTDSQTREIHLPITHEEEETIEKREMRDAARRAEKQIGKIVKEKAIVLEDDLIRLHKIQNIRERIKKSRLKISILSESGVYTEIHKDTFNNNDQWYLLLMTGHIQIEEGEFLEKVFFKKSEVEKCD